MKPTELKRKERKNKNHNETYSHLNHSQKYGTIGFFKSTKAWYEKGLIGHNEVNSDWTRSCLDSSCKFSFVRQLTAGARPLACSANGRGSVQRGVEMNL